MLYWADQHNICCFLDNHQYNLPVRHFECIAGVGERKRVQADAGSALDQLDSFLLTHNDWCFGHLSYDIKNEIEQLSSLNPDGIGFPDLNFFVPDTVLMLQPDHLVIGSFGNHEEIWKQIKKASRPVSSAESSAVIQNRLSREDYLSRIENLRNHILRGDCYEINFCQEFYCHQAAVNPPALYQSLCMESPNPYACYYKADQRYLLCASPERYLHRRGSKVLSQPIKGTAPRYPENAGADAAAGEALRSSEKDRSENVMVVDLVRNDLSKVCVEGSVKVEELFEVYSFPQVYQMISTVSGELKNTVTIADIFRASFPMASMTGVPKKRVMELIERYEVVKRGLYSGAVGYISPERDFDFNVVIRSILYNAKDQYLSFQTGSAITFNSNAAAEYEECLVKARAIKKVLNG